MKCAVVVLELNFLLILKFVAHLHRNMLLKSSSGWWRSEYRAPYHIRYVRSTDSLKISNSQAKVRCHQRVEQEKERCKASFCCCMLGARWDPNVESANSVGFVGCGPL